MRICNKTKAPTEPAPKRGRVYKHMATKDLYMAVESGGALALANLDSGMTWAFDKGFGKEAHNFVDVTDKVCLDVSQLED